MVKKVASKSKKKPSPAKKTAAVIKAKKKVTKKAAAVKAKAAVAKAKKKVVKKAALVKAKKKVTAIPKGYHSITPYLIFENTARAIDFYKKAFGAKVVLQMEHSGRVSHAELQIGGAKFMLADEHPEMDVRGPKAYGGSPISIHLYVKNVDGTVTKAHAEGAKIVRPIQNMFYGDRIGLLEDPFGYKWSVATHIEDVSKATLKKRAAELFGKDKT